MEHLDKILIGLAGLVTAIASALVALRRKRDNQELKDHFSTQVKKANGVPWAFIDNMPDPSWCKDLDGKYLWVNQEYSLRFKVKPSAIEGKTDYDMWPPDVANELRRNDLRVAREQVLLKTEEAIPDRVGEHSTMKRSWTVWKFPIFGPAGNVIAVGGISRLAEDQDVCTPPTIASRPSRKLGTKPPTGKIDGGK